MKKALIITVLALPLLAQASLDTNLRLGMRGDDVIELQDLLASENCLTVAPTGYFGLLTLSGVKCFQTKHSIESTGYVGVLTRTKANEILTSAGLESDVAEMAETGTTTVAVKPCTNGALFNTVTGAPCSSTAIQQTIANTVIQTVNAVSPTPNVGSANQSVASGVTVKANGGTIVVSNNSLKTVRVKGISVSFSSSDFTQEQLDQIVSSISYRSNGDSPLVNPERHADGSVLSIGYGIFKIDLSNVPKSSTFKKITATINSIYIVDSQSDESVNYTQDPNSSSKFTVNIDQTVGGEDVYGYGNLN